MKKLLLCLLLGANRTGYSQFFPASVNEYTYPPAVNNIAMRSQNSSAYSYSNLNNQDYYLYSWDGGSNLSTPVPASGFAFLEYATGSGIGLPPQSSVNPTGFPAGDAVSIEVVLLQSSTELLVLCTYYQVSTKRFMLNLFSWDGANLNQVTGYPINLSVAPPSNFEWIRLDALDLNKFIITWSEGGDIYTKAGKVGTNLTLGNTAQLAAQDMACNQPDVALINAEEIELVMAHYVYTSGNDTKLYVAGIRFEDVYTSAPLAILANNIEDLQTANGSYRLPRIDAPDDFAKDDWSYVVEDYDPLTGSIIFAGVMNQSIGLDHYRLNDGSEPGYPTADLSAFPNVNTKPVVAYAESGSDIYYGWGYEGNNPSIPASIDYTLLGIKIDNLGNFLVPVPNQVDYSLVPQQLDDASPQLSLALSGSNTHSSGLFIAFTQSLATGYSMGIKSTSWSDAHFRPSPVEILPNTVADFSVYPNPFSTTIQLNSTRQVEPFEIQLFDPLGRIILKSSGSLAEVNQTLFRYSNRLAAGHYFLQISKDEGVQLIFKLSKVQ